MAPSTNPHPNTLLFENSDNSINDPLSISNSDHPGMVLTQTPFNGGNFLGWSKNIKMTLGAKLKLGFIDGTCVKPAVTDVNYQRYGQSNEPLIYQLERELSHISQGNIGIAFYFNKLKRCSDELQHLNGLPSCTCGKMRECSCGILDKFLEMDNREQKQVTYPSFEPSTFFANLQCNKETNDGKKDFKNSGPIKIEFKRVCTRCNQEGHIVEQCFERIGYPDWYKGKGIADGGTLNANQASFSMHYACIFSCFTSTFALRCHPAVIKIIRTDNETEIVNKACLAFLSSKEIVHQKSIPEIVHQKSIPYTPQYGWHPRVMGMGTFNPSPMTFFLPVTHPTPVCGKYPEWVQAMQAELDALEKNHTWELTSLPSGHKVISSKWKDKDQFTAVLVYVDDILIIGNCQIEISSKKLALDKKFTIKDLGLAQYFLGIEIHRTSHGTHLNQRKYILDIFHDASLTATKPVASPMPTNLKLSLRKGNLLSNPEAYRRLVGRFLYLTMTRPNISYVVQYLSQFVYAPTD
uniref:Uncharacterized mitochondrial protein AtMg00810-like n=1 Tax=Tanacetum cinerariifolium TaxID=118510 RepID=A0A6L2NUK7_TANCI|nr:uncharacterized mitochondrial protein AtMg00810-like [Tanacetum cinerariifolium]